MKTYWNRYYKRVVRPFGPAPEAALKSRLTAAPWGAGRLSLILGALSRTICPYGPCGFVQRPFGVQAPWPGPPRTRERNGWPVPMRPWGSDRLVCESESSRTHIFSQIALLRVQYSHLLDPGRRVQMWSTPFLPTPPYRMHRRQIFGAWGRPGNESGAIDRLVARNNIVVLEERSDKTRVNCG